MSSLLRRPQATCAGITKRTILLLAPRRAVRLRPKTESTLKIHLVQYRLGKKLPVFSSTGVSGVFRRANQKCTRLRGKWMARMLPPIQDSWEPYSDKHWPVEGCESPGHPSITPFDTLSPRVRLPPLSTTNSDGSNNCALADHGQGRLPAQLSFRESNFEKAA